MPRHQLPELPYPYNALEPYIDEMTMKIHHTKHHQAYVDNLNSALDKYPEFYDYSVEELLKNISKVPKDIRQQVINHGGGHANHTFFWKIMAPNSGGEPSGNLASAINSSFNSFSGFKEQFTKVALGHFGSGWAWLVLNPKKKLQIISTPNQDSPLMKNQIPLIGIDLWEHAYYLKYQNRRADYISAWWNVVNWRAVEERFNAAKI
jgi:Fe-Mn family superoxide dismutase